MCTPSLHCSVRTIVYETSADMGISDFGLGCFSQDVTAHNDLYVQSASASYFCSKSNNMIIGNFYIALFSYLLKLTALYNIL